jgi:hypothetical protein
VSGGTNIFVHSTHDSSDLLVTHSPNYIKSVSYDADCFWEFRSDGIYCVVMYTVVRTTSLLLSRAIDAPRRYMTTNTLQQIEQQRLLLKQIEQRKKLVACKIFLNAGGDESHVPVLSKLILHAQEAFSKAALNLPPPHPQPSDTTSTTGESEAADLAFTHVGALVHAYVDPCSNRSSLHLAGPVMDIIKTVNDLIETAVTELRERNRGGKISEQAATVKTFHRLFDIIEHVSFLPLVPGDQSAISDNKCPYTPTWVPTYGAYAARQVGAFMEEKVGGIKVYFYENAQRTNCPLPLIAERRTKHFSKSAVVSESVLVGACRDFVEDFHVILSAQCGKGRANQLAGSLRDPGSRLVDFEAIAQQYDEYRWDVHCRLLRPHLTGATIGDVERAVLWWKKQQNGRSHRKDDWIVKCYRVGATYDQCLNVLKEVCISDENRKKHDNEVREIFNGFAQYDTSS